MRLDTLARLSLVRCRIPQLIPSHRMARHARTLQQAAILSSATSSTSTSSHEQLAEQISIEESIIAHRRLAMGDLDSATASSTPTVPPPQPSPDTAADTSLPSRSLSIVVSGAAAATTSHPSPQQSQVSSSPTPSTLVLPSSYLLSPASSAAGAGLPESSSLSRASSPSPSIVSECADSTLPSVESRQQSADRCPSPAALLSYYLSPPLPPSSATDPSCPELTVDMSEELPASAADLTHSSPPSASADSNSRPPSARSQRIAQCLSLYSENGCQSPASAASPSSSSSSSPHSLVVPKPRRLHMSHPYHTPPIARHHYYQQQSDLQIMMQQQQHQQQLLAQQYAAALQQSSLPRYLPSTTAVLASPSHTPSSATFHFTFPPPSSFSSYLISTLPDTQPATLTAMLRV